MGDPKYWKRKYKEIWPAGCEREKIFVDLFKSWGLVPIPFGFEALSTDYNPESPKEKGKPDFYVDFDDGRIYFEVTGTDSQYVKPYYDIWIRPDKIDYVERHNIIAYTCHILNNSYNLIRFIDMNNFGERRIVHRTIRGARETYLAIASSKTISVNSIKIILGLV